MVDLPLAVGNGGGRVRRPSFRRRQHAKGFGEIERDGGHGRLPLVRTARLRHLRLGGRWREYLWPGSRCVGRDEPRRGCRPLLVELRGVPE